MTLLSKCKREAETIRGIILAVLDSKDYRYCSSNRHINVGNTFGGSKVYEHPCGGSIIMRDDDEDSYKWSMVSESCILNSNKATMFTTNTNALFTANVSDGIPLLENMNDEALFQLSLIHDDDYLCGLVLVSLLRGMDLPSFSMSKYAVSLGVERWTSKWAAKQGSKWK